MAGVMKMNQKADFPKRKELRIKEYDYSSAGAYFVTVCIKDRKRILADIVDPSVGVDALANGERVGLLYKRNKPPTTRIPDLQTATKSSAIHR